MHYSISSHTFYFGNASRAYANWLAATRKCVFKLSSEIFHLFSVCLPPVKLLPIVFRLNNPKWQFSSVRQVGSRTNSSLRTGWDTAGKRGWLLRLKKNHLICGKQHPPRKWKHTGSLSTTPYRGEQSETAAGGHAPIPLSPPCLNKITGEHLDRSPSSCYQNTHVSQKRLFASPGTRLM